MSKKINNTMVETWWSDLKKTINKILNKNKKVKKLYIVLALLFFGLNANAQDGNHFLYSQTDKIQASENSREFLEDRIFEIQVENAWIKEPTTFKCSDLEVSWLFTYHFQSENKLANYLQALQYEAVELQYIGDPYFSYLEHCELMSLLLDIDLHILKSFVEYDGQYEKGGNFFKSSSAKKIRFNSYLQNYRNKEIPPKINLAYIRGLKNHWWYNNNHPLLPRVLELKEVNELRSYRPEILTKPNACWAWVVPTLKWIAKYILLPSGIQQAQHEINKRATTTTTTTSTTTTTTMVPIYQTKGC